MSLPGDQSSPREINDALLEGRDLSASAPNRLSVDLAPRPGRNAVAARMPEQCPEACEDGNAALECAYFRGR